VWLSLSLLFAHLFSRGWVTERRRGWPETQRYLKFVLYKENKETMDALAILSSLLRYFSMCVCVENM
jgi:hypothetical protein